ncbi:hypothetical protein Desde_1114 [Desulfitobacterium dehalogenans ATCC 51507]|uniref:Uncharacterized protein n=1 Tax=Desulfitobacterium dehalogenans (strain ATCC 51507 / DSM 9161 / JW/IU-DC1) TaxID=756499 RepID=I4A6G2_DESDJ|nr:hypothetical protein [Desulfitobacterium dehalogenans]AFL99546.1 hypothetical protein Desde_1114 [Desulfitobacterium dehalogenans ATCC 51507]
MKLYRISRQVLEQAERMAAKWEARSEAWWNKQSGGSDEGWGYSTADYCKTLEEAEACESRAEEIHQALAQVTGSAYTPVAPWSVIETLKAAAVDRDVLDMSM